jgi:cytochrome P450
MQFLRKGVSRIMTAKEPIKINLEGNDIQGEGARLRAEGRPVALVELPGQVQAWAAGNYGTLQKLLADPRVSRSASQHWAAWKRNEIPEDWPLRIWAAVQNMGNSYGADHRRLRGLMSYAFTARRTAALRPQIEGITAGLLDAIAAQPEHDAVDLRAAFAYPLPIEVITRLFGVPDQMRPGLRRAIDTSFDTGATPEQTQTAITDMFRLLNELVAVKRSAPADDLTSAMIGARDDDNDAFSERELVDTLSLMLVAGHETTANLLDQALAAMLANPGQLSLVRDGERSWSDVIEETLRWQAPIPYIPLRYAVEDIELEGITIPQGDAILACYAAAGRDKDQYGASADYFDITRPDKQHLSFGYGVHRCLGAPLARLEAEIALPAIFARFPDLALGVAPSELAPLRSFLANGHIRLPVIRYPRQRF